VAAVDNFDKLLKKRELKVVSGLTSPPRIQSFLDGLAYSDEPVYRCPLAVLRDRKAHCFDGALFGAAMLRRLGYPPLILDLIPHNDDDHLLAVYKVGRHWGAVAKSNFVGLRFREPIHRSLRELVLTYFESYYNLLREKSLRAYTAPLDLSKLDELDWMTSNRGLDEVADRTDRLRRFQLLDRKMLAGLSLLDQRSYEAGMVGTNPAGVYQPSKSQFRAG
jgi:hypothetical protein